MHADADGEFRHDFGHARLKRLAELQKVAIGLHAGGKPDGRLAVEAEDRLRRVGIAARDRADVGQAEEAVAHAQVHIAQALLGFELAVDAHADALGAGLDRARRRNGVLRLQALDDGVAIEVERRELARRKVEVDDLVLRADQLDLAGIGNLEHLGADILHVIAQLTHGEPIAGEGIDIAEHIAELIVEPRRLHPLRKLVPDIGDHVAHPGPNAGDVARLGIVPEVHEDRGLPRRGVALHIIERVRVLRASSRCGR